MATRRSSQLTIGYSPTWEQQSAWDTPLVNGDLTRAFPATSRNYIDVEETTEDVMDCTGEDFLFEILTGQIARLTVDFDVDPDILAGPMAFAYGVAASPSAGTNEVQTETSTASGGTKTYTVQIGANAQTTTPVAFDADAATIQAALEALSNVAPGDITVAGAGPFTFTMGGSFAGQDVALIKINTFGLTGGTSVMVTTTPGLGSTHAISRMTGYTLPLMTLYIGFRGSSEQPVIMKNTVVNSIRVRSASREKVTATMELIGNVWDTDGNFDYATGYTMPECQDILPLRFGDCKYGFGSTDFIASNLGREFEYYYENNVTPKFDGQGVNATRHERADQRPSGMNFWILGEPGDSWYDLFATKPTLSAYIQCGPDGRNVRFNAPQGFTKLGTPPIRFGGDPAESEIVVVVRPKKVSGIATTPTNVSAVIAQSTILMNPA